MFERVIGIEKIFSFLSFFSFFFISIICFVMFTVSLSSLRIRFRFASVIPLPKSSVNTVGFIIGIGGRQDVQGRGS